jgi:putative phosphoesterase
MRIGVLSDTHVPDRTAELPAEILELLRGVDLILHAGDISTPAALDRLRTIAPVVAVRGNRDGKALPFLPEKTVVSAGHWQIGLIHGDRSYLAETADRLRYLLQVLAGQPVQCIVFGHTHQACNERQDGVLFFNPGGVVRSPGGGPSSVGILDVDSQGIAGAILALKNPPIAKHFLGLAG